MSGDEHEVRRSIITPWLENHGCDVWWEKGAGRDETFNFTGCGRPDMLVSGSETVLIELKARGDTRMMADAMLQAFGYLESLLDGAKVEVNGDQVKVDGVLVANEHSWQGTLYDEEPTDEHFNSKRTSADLPMTEGQRTEQYVRMQWALYRDRFEDQPLGFGALLSDRLNGLEGRYIAPHALWYRDTTRTKQEFTRL